MSPVSAKKRLTLPSAHASMMDYLDDLGINLSSGLESKVERVLGHFNVLAQQGYDLSLADGTAEVEARKKLRVFPEYFDLTEFSVQTRKYKSSPVEHTAAVKVLAGGKEFHEIDSSEAGSVHAVRSALRKVLRRVYPEAKPVRLIGYHVDSFRLNKEENNETLNRDAIKTLDEEDKIDTASPTRVTVVFRTVARGRSLTYAVQDVQAGVMDASIYAVAKGLEYGLYRQGLKAR